MTNQTKNLKFNFHQTEVSQSECRISKFLQTRSKTPSLETRHRQAENLRGFRQNVSLGFPPEIKQFAKEKLECQGFNGYWQYQLDYYLELWSKNAVLPENCVAFRYLIADGISLVATGKTRLNEACA